MGQYRAALAGDRCPEGALLMIFRCAVPRVRFTRDEALIDESGGADRARTVDLLRRVFRFRSRTRDGARSPRSPRSSIRTRRSGTARAATASWLWWSSGRAFTRAR